MAIQLACQDFILLFISDLCVFYSPGSWCKIPQPVLFVSTGSAFFLFFNSLALTLRQVSYIFVRQKS